MNKTVLPEVIDIVKKYTSYPIAELSLDMSLADIGVDSLNIVSIIFDIEDAYSVEVDISEMDPSIFLTVGGLCSLVNHITGASPA